MRPPVRLHGLATAVVLTLTLTLAGCGSDDSDEGAVDPPSVTEPSPEPTPSATQEPTDATPSATQEPTDGPTSPPRGLRAALLTVDTLPAPGDVTWESVSTKRGAGTDDVSLCQVTELYSLGSTRGATRTFGSGSVEATQVVAQFVDEQGSTQAYDVLEAWLGRCAGQGKTRGFDQVDAPAGFTPVDAGERAGWALLSYGPVPGDPDASFLETQSLVRVGDTLSWVVWTQIGQDYNYEPGQAPPERAVALLADALAAT